MSTTLFVAVVACIGTSGDYVSVNGQSVLAKQTCDVLQWIDAGPDLDHMNGYSLEVCRKKLDEMNERGSVVKMCVPLTSDVIGLGDFRVQWSH